MNNAPRPEWVDLSETVETISKITWIILFAAFLFVLLCDFYITDALDCRLRTEEMRNANLVQQGSAIREGIEFQKGRIASFLDPVTEWWYATAKGQESFKRLIINKILLFNQVIRYDNARLARQWRLN